MSRSYTPLPPALLYFYQQLWGYKVEDKLYLGVREQKRLNITGPGLHQANMELCRKPPLLPPWLYSPCKDLAGFTHRRLPYYF
jgi:hypothetical protein